MKSKKIGLIIILFTALAFTGCKEKNKNQVLTEVIRSWHSLLDSLHSDSELLYD